MGSFVIFALLILSYLFTWGVWYPTTLLIHSNWSKMVRERNRWEIRTKQNKTKKKGQPWPISQLLPSQERKREETRKRRRLERKKYGDFVLVYLINFFFFFFMKVYLSHLDVTSAHGFILHMIYYFLACWFLFFLFF